MFYKNRFDKLYPFPVKQRQVIHDHSLLAYKEVPEETDLVYTQNITKPIIKKSSGMVEKDVCDETTKDYHYVSINSM